MKAHKYRQELQNRTISPSSGSWEKLDGKLSFHEKKRKTNGWLFLKVASVILVFVSVGFYFLKQEEVTIPIEIAAPAPEEKINKIPAADDVIETEIAVVPNDPLDQKKAGVGSNKHKQYTNEVVFAEPLEVRETSVIEKTETVSIGTGINETPGTAKVHAEEHFIDDEIEQLLHQSKIKLIVNGQISSKKLVNADALLNSVEDDLNKDLKQKLLEKIVNTIKKEKEVVTSKEN